MMTGRHVVDTVMFRLENACKYLWHVKYFASYLLVLTLASPDWKISTLVDEFQGGVLILFASFYFL